MAAKNYVMPSLHFHLAVNQVKQTTIQMLEDIIAKTMKKWLRLPRSATRALLHHPAIISSVPQVSLAYKKAKISLLSALASTTNPIVDEVNDLFKDSKFQIRQGIPKETNGQLVAARWNPKRAKSLLSEESRTQWELKLVALKVQGKALEAIDLEKENKAWKRIADGLPSGQLSFILRACSDTLPTQFNLQRWKFQLQAKCFVTLEMPLYVTF